MTPELEEIEKIKNIIASADSFNIPFLKEVVRQGELKGKDENDRKIRIDTRTYMLLFLQFFTLIAVLVIPSFSKYFLIQFSIVSILTALMFYTFEILKSRSYGALGNMPQSFLIKEYLIDEYYIEKKGDHLFGFTLSHVACNMIKTLERSIESNEKRLVIFDRSLNLTRIIILISMITLCLIKL